MTLDAPFPSPFYDLFLGARERTLIAPVDRHGEGPFWDDDGEVQRFEQGELLESVLAVVDLGAGRYRLAQNPFIGDFTRLAWGDEFHGHEEASGAVRITRIAVPLRFRHERSLIGGRFLPGNPESDTIHALGGGWETIAGGILCVTLPVPAWDAYMTWRLRQAARKGPAA